LECIINIYKEFIKSPVRCAEISALCDNIRAQFFVFDFISDAFLHDASHAGRVTGVTAPAGHFNVLKDFLQCHGNTPFTMDEFLEINQKYPQQQICQWRGILNMA
jgi:hypothetical protein